MKAGMRLFCGVSLVFLLSLAGCDRGRAAVQAEPSATEAPPKEPATQRTEESIHVGVDRNVELFALLFRLAGNAEYQQAYKTPYLAAVEEHFGKYREHPAVLASRELRDQHGISFNAPVGLAAFLTQVPALEPIRALSPAPASLDHRWASVDIDSYLAKVRQFVKDTDFVAFMDGQEPYFGQVAKRFNEAIKPGEVVSWFDTFFGQRAQADYYVVPGMLMGPSNYGATAEDGAGRERLYQVVWLENLDAAGLPRPSEETEALLVHEMAHAYVNPIVERHEDALKRAGTALFALVEEPMSKQAYTKWQIMMKESGVRAATILFLKEKRGNEAAARALGDDEANSFLWLGDLVTLFEDYQRNRTQYPDLDAFFPRVVSLFDTWASEHKDGLPRLTFRGPINGVFAASRKTSMAFVHSGKSPAIEKYAKSMRDRFAKGTKVFSDDQADVSSLDSASLLLYGSPKTNRVTHEFLEQLGWNVAADSIRIGERTFSGEHLVLVACHPLPSDPSRALLFYTAADDADLVDPNSIFHGPTDWVVARHTGQGKYEMVAKGDFPKDLEGHWSKLTTAK